MTLIKIPKDTILKIKYKETQYRKCSQVTTKCGRLYMVTETPDRSRPGVVKEVISVKHEGYWHILMKRYAFQKPLEPPAFDLIEMGLVISDTIDYKADHC